MINVESILKNNYENFYTKYPRILTKSFTSFLRLLLHEKEINTFMKNNHAYGIDFVDKVLESYDVSYEVKSSQVENIPAMGSVVVIANHPLGGMDSLILLKMISSARHDKKVKIVANDMLMSFNVINDMLIPMNNMEGKVSKQSHQAIVDSLNADEAVIFFPSGEVSRACLLGNKKEQWKSGFIKFARSCDAPILPIHLNCKNSWKFYFLSAIYKPFGTLLLSHEMLSPKYKIIKASIGELIPQEAFSNKNISLKIYTKLFKKHLFRLQRGKKPIFATQKCIAHPQQRHLLKAELQQAKLLGHTTDHKRIYLLESKKAPAMMAEIGRLREFSFRKVGEGSGLKRDVDSYDSYYKHLVLWDDNDLEIVGAYRIGETEKIVANGAYADLYMHELCSIEKPFKEISANAIELGRSFVQPKYWGSRALDYLWQGIGAYLKEYKHINYLYGPVSISASYPTLAKDALVYFFSLYFKPENAYFKAYDPYIVSKSQKDIFRGMFNGHNYKEDFTTLKEYLKNFDATVPTLFKQYSDLCIDNGVSFSDFGKDENFNDCVDGYLMVDLSKVKPKKRERYFE
jgi:putative hemolysin